MTACRVAVVDDSGTMRTILARFLSSVPEMQLVGSYSSAEEMFGAIGRDKPDVVTLDVEMPGMHGMEALQRLRTEHPQVKAVMCSSHTQKGRAQTISALCAGAWGAVCKPVTNGEMNEFRDELVTQVRAARGSRALARPTLKPAPVRRVRKSTEVPKLIVMGSSTGGPNALTELFGSLPANFPVPIALVQHLPNGFSEELADRIRRTSRLPTVVARNGEPLITGLNIANAGEHLKIRMDRGQLVCVATQEAPQQGCRPSVDVLFDSAAEAVPERTLGIVLTGMGRDGARGAKRLFENGARIWAQDEASSVVWGMPGAVVGEGCYDAVLSLKEISERLDRLCLRGRVQ